MWLFTGDMYHGVNILTGKHVAVKLEPIDVERPRLRHKQTVYKLLGHSVEILQVLWFGSDHRYTAMVTNLLRPSLETLYNACGSRFSLKTVFMLAGPLVCSHYYSPLKSLSSVGSRGC